MFCRRGGGRLQDGAGAAPSAASGKDQVGTKTLPTSFVVCTPTRANVTAPLSVPRDIIEVLLCVTLCTLCDQ